MKKSFILSLLLGLGASQLSHAGDVADAIDAKAPIASGGTCFDFPWDASRVDSHAPIGVMADHTHEAGEIMLSYRYMYMHMDGHQAGTDSLSTHQVFQRGYAVAAEEMDMHMHMWSAMYAPTDNLTFMAMLNYVEKDMELVANPHGMMHGHDMGHGGGHTGRFGHSSAGLGDFSLGALYKLYDDRAQRVHAGLALNFPTGDVEQKQDGVYLPYGMQLGSGTWDLSPSLTYLGQCNDLSWGAQGKGTFRLEDEGDSGFSYGDAVDVTAWTALRLCDSASISGRLGWHYEDDIDGHYNGAHNHVAPPHFQQNYGGHTLEAGIGLNLKAVSGPLKGHRLAIEALTPIYQDLNGVGMDREYSLVAGWQFAF
ncbi:MAG: transporter [Verrucomicrobiae bacterium]|nr:transporter [Verrucomicrobiae bacterium]